MRLLFIYADVTKEQDKKNHFKYNMRRMMQKLKWVILMCGCIFSFASQSDSKVYSPRVGQLHPDFTLPNIANREPVSLSQFLGRKLLLVHFSSW